jgi:hypothetical protein
MQPEPALMADGRLPRLVHAHYRAQHRGHDLEQARDPDRVGEQQQHGQVSALGDQRRDHKRLHRSICPRLHRLARRHTGRRKRDLYIHEGSTQVSLSV